MARLFFALWPDDAARAALARLGEELAAAAGGKPVPATKIHLTLAFLGDGAEERALPALAAGAEVRAPPMELLFDRVGSFRAARVAWSGMFAVPPQLATLQEQLAAALGGQGFALEAREFIPHLTLVRKIERSVAPASMPPIRWRASELALVRSELGTGRYANVEKWALDGA